MKKLLNIAIIILWLLPCSVLFAGGINICTYGHNWSEWMIKIEPTCETDGEEYRYCKTNSNHIETKKINAIGHIYDGLYCKKCNHAHSFSKDLAYSHTQLGAYLSGIGNCLDTEIFVPNQIIINQTSYSVIGISDSAFINNSSITKIVVPNTCTEIGNNTFSNCVNLIEFSTADNYKYISAIGNLGNNAFENCKKLTKVVLNENTKTISSKSFYNCNSLNEFTIPLYCKNIEKDAFINCNNLKKITFTNAELPHIDLNAFGSFSNPTIYNYINQIEFNVPEIYCDSLKNEFNGFWSNIKNYNIVPINIVNFGYYNNCNQLGSIKLYKNNREFLGGVINANDTILFTAQPIENAFIEGWYNNFDMLSQKLDFDGTNNYSFNSYTIIVPQTPYCIYLKINFVNNL